MYAILTNVMDIAHLTVLEDWLGFTHFPPQQLIAHVGPGVATELRILSNKRDIDVVILGEASAVEVSQRETQCLHEQFLHSRQKFSLVIRLDTLPTRDGHDFWLRDAIQRIQSQGYLYFTGSTQPYRADQKLDATHYYKTQRASNNCLLINAEAWLTIQKSFQGERSEFGRYETEAILEQYCQLTQKWGLRRANSRDWRVFHTQVWDDRMPTIRQKFLAGVDIDSYLTGYQDDLRRSWEMYYMAPRPRFLKRVRKYISRNVKNALENIQSRIGSSSGIER